MKHKVDTQSVFSVSVEQCFESSVYNVLIDKHISSPVEVPVLNLACLQKLDLIF